MKKLKKLSVLALLAVGFALVFGGCSNGSSDTEEEEKKEEQKEEEKDPEAPEKTGIIIGDKVYAFADLEIEAGNWLSDDSVKTDGGNLMIDANGSYGNLSLTLSSNIDISGKKVALTAKVDADYEQGTNTFKLVFCESDTNQTEITGKNTVDNSGWHDKNSGDFKITTEFKKYISTTDDMRQNYGAENEADLTKINKIIIYPQTGKGKIIIQSIEFVD